MDRLRQVVDPRNYSTTFEYNTRGQVTKITHDQDGTYAQRGYNADGTLAWAADENHPNASWNVNERTRYAYDDYKRVISVTNPMNQTASYVYAQDWVNSYVQTTSNPKGVFSPMGKAVHYAYDENWRRTIMRVPPGSDPNDAWTFYGYDEVGNLTSVQDPRGNVTTFAYDARDRRTSMTDPIPTDRNSYGHTFDWEYDTRSNLTKETRADSLFRRMEYDPMSRVIDAYGFANEHVHYERDLAGNVRQLVDPKPATYFFDYDAMNRKTGATYPLDATNATRTESWHYDFAGNMDQYTNPAGQIKTLGYDTRNRLYTSSWNAGGQTVGLGYDNASRLTIVTTNTNETTVVFGYDDANRQTWEEQTVAGYPTRRVETPRDSDGNRSALSVPGWYGIQYDYTQRNQLRTIYDGNHVSWFSYSYDATGNMTKRQDVYGGVNDSTNVMDANGASQYDALNRPMMWEQTGTVNGTHDSAFARSHFGYDSLSRLTWSWRDEQAGKGEWFGYHATGQLSDVAYNADNVSSGTPQNATRTVNYTMTADTLNRSTMNDTGEISAYTPNALNQYESINGGGLYYDGNFNLMWTGGFSAGYDANKRLIAIGSGEDYGQFVYDGLGRCLKRTIDWETVLVTYDGWKPIVEWDQWNGLKAWNVYGPGPDEILYRHDAYLAVDLRYHLDRMGNVAFLLDSDGDGIERYTYDAFGAPTVTDWNGNNARPYSWYGNRFMFTGREYFPELGLYDYRHRFYHPVLGRFLQSDPMGFDGGDANLFRYCGGDPVNNSDAAGQNVDEGYHFGEFYVPHWFFGVDDPLSGTGKTWFDFSPTTINVLWTQGRWSYNSGRPVDVSVGTTLVTTLPQDLVILSAFVDAYENPGTYSLVFGNDCDQAGRRIIEIALGPNGTSFNPVDPYTGNIFSANGNYVGWQDPDTGNLYDSEGDWAGWNPTWNSGSGTGRTIGSYGTADGYGGGNFDGAGPNGFGGLGAGFGGVAGGFIYGIGGVGFGGVGNNSKGETFHLLN